MYGAYYVFSKPFFRGWIVVSIIWIFSALLIVTIMPPVEGRGSIWATITGQQYNGGNSSNAVQHDVEPIRSSGNSSSGDQTVASDRNPAGEKQKKEGEVPESA